MSFLIVPTSELEAVNECLSNIGQAPVSTITGDLSSDTETALNMVRTVNRALQSKGWYWNTEKNFELSPNVDGDILIPSNSLSVDTTGDSSDLDLVARGRRLYDRENHTYTFTDPVYVELVIGLTFEELPETARRYISLKSARLFQNRLDGVESGLDTADEKDAYADLHADQLRVEDSNILTGSYGMLKTLNRFAF